MIKSDRNIYVRILDLYAYNESCSSTNELIWTWHYPPPCQHSFSSLLLFEQFSRAISNWRKKRINVAKITKITNQPIENIIIKFVLPVESEPIILYRGYPLKSRATSNPNPSWTNHYIGYPLKSRDTSNPNPSWTNHSISRIPTQIPRYVQSKPILNQAFLIWTN